MLTGGEGGKFSRKADIVADAAYAILTQDPKTTTGNFFIDDTVLTQFAGITDFDQYAVDPAFKDQLMPDFFVDANELKVPTEGPSLAKASAQGTQKSQSGQSDDKIAGIFKAIENNLSADTIQKTQAVFQFIVTGNDSGKWFVDLKNAPGSCGKGEAPTTPDATLTMDSQNFFDMFSGRLKPAAAFMTGKLKISGNMQKALKLDKLMGSLKAKL